MSESSSAVSHAAAADGGALPLDHVVIAVHDLARAIDDWSALGFTVLPGGQHPGRTSHNALIVFEDGAYLELIAWQGPAPQERWYRTLTDDGEGLVDFALLPADTLAALAAAHARGLATLVGPVDGGRVRPDGERLQWRTARHATPDLPFLCGDVTPRRLRVPDAPEARRHANGATGVAGLRVAVTDLAATLARYRALLGEGLEMPVIASASPGIASARLALPGFTLELHSPLPRGVDGDGVVPEVGPAQALRQRLATRGEGPDALLLRGPRDAAPLEGASTHGVDLRWA